MKKALLFALLGIATAVWGAVLTPVAGERMEVFGEPWGEPCPVRAETGHPCPMCGMTRSWAWAARGQIPRALSYSPAGATLWAGLVTAGVIGLCRLVTRDPKRLLVPWQLLVGAVGFWLVVLYAGVWVWRRFGGLPLP